MKKAFKEVYRRIPLKRELFSLLKLFGTPSERIYRHLHFIGDFTVVLDAFNSFKMRHYGYELENTLFWRGVNSGWESNCLKIWSELATDSRVVFDIGANTGIFALVAKAKNRQSKVYGFEPIKRVFEKLVRNNELNGFDINCLEIAASNEDGNATIYDMPHEHSYSSTFHREVINNDEWVSGEVAVIKLKTLIEREKLATVDLMKIDVEGHEAEVLEGLGEYLDKFRPTILIEILTDEVGNRVEKFLEGKGYIYFYFDETNSSLFKVDRLSRRRDYNYLVCQEQVVLKLGLDT